jgi:hypothetical protein
VWRRRRKPILKPTKIDYDDLQIDDVKQIKPCWAMWC